LVGAKKVTVPVFMTREEVRQVIKCRKGWKRQNYDISGINYSPAEKSFGKSGNYSPAESGSKTWQSLLALCTGSDSKR